MLKKRNTNYRFIGGGLNARSMQAAIDNSLNSPSKTTVPAGATWPFVTLSVGKQFIEFNMMHIKKSVTPKDVEEIRLSKYGYLFFRTTDSSKDFGFTTLKLGQLLSLLEEQGYKLHPSCRQNYRLANFSLVAILVTFLAIFITVTTLAILKPNGV